MPPRLIAALTALLWLAGCAVPRPPQQVAAATPPQWYAPLPHDGTLADLTRWWQQFNDPPLLRVVVAAQDVSPDIASAAARIAQARAARINAQAARLPSVDSSLAATRGNVEVAGTPATTLQGGTQASWEIDLFGRNRLASEAASQRLLGAEAAWHAARVAVAAEAASSYVGLRTCERLLSVLQADVQSRAETARLIRLSAEAGFAAPAEAALARASAAESAARAQQQRGQCAQELKALVALTGIPEPQLRAALDAEWTEPERFSLLAVAPLPAALLAQRPDVHAAAQEVAAASADVGVAHADRYPRLVLNGQIGTGLVHVAGETTRAKAWSIGPLAVTLPVFDGGRRVAAEEAAVARYEEAVALYHAQVRQAVAEVERALVALASARARSEDARTAAEGYRASFRAAESLYRAGLGNLIQLEDQRRIALSAQTTLVNLQRERLGAWIALYRAMGGGWTAPPTR